MLKNANQTTVSTSELSKGIYLVEITTENAKLTVPIVN
jgi:hypothetical protein